MIRTLFAQVLLVKELLRSGYDNVILRKLRSDPLEKRFSQYRQMSGDRFLVSLREVLNSERISQCRSLLKENVNIWEDDVAPVGTHTLGTFINFIETDDSHLYEAALTDDSNEVATTIAGYIAKKLIKRPSCIICKSCLGSEKGINFENKYFDNLSRGGLTIPSSSLAEFVSNGFAILDSADEKITEYVLMKYSEPVRFTCEAHVEWGMKFSSRIITNIFYNNKQI